MTESWFLCVSALLAEDGGVWSPAIEEAEELYPEDSPATSSNPAPWMTSRQSLELDFNTYTA